MKANLSHNSKRTPENQDYWFVLVLLVLVAGGELMSSCLVQPAKNRPMTANINNSFFI